MGSIMDQERPWERGERTYQPTVEERVTAIEDMLIKLSEHPFFVVSPLALWADRRKKQKGTK